MATSEQSNFSPSYFKVTHQRRQNKIRKIFTALLNVDKELSLMVASPQLFFYLMTVLEIRQRQSSYSRSPCQESLEEEREKERA